MSCSFSHETWITSLLRTFTLCVLPDHSWPPQVRNQLSYYNNAYAEVAPCYLLMISKQNTRMPKKNIQFSLMEKVKLIYKVWSYPWYGTLSREAVMYPSMSKDYKYSVLPWVMTPWLSVKSPTYLLTIGISLYISFVFVNEIAGAIVVALVMIMGEA